MRRFVTGHYERMDSRTLATSPGIDSSCWERKTVEQKVAGGKAS